VVITDEGIRISQLLGARARTAPKVYPYVINQPSDRNFVAMCIVICKLSHVS